MTEQQVNEALEKLNRGIEESRQMVQQRTMGLAQDYFSDSVEQMKQEIQQSRKTLENLPDQVPGGQDEAFQMLFQELMDNYAAVEEALGEAQNNVANLDTDSLVAQGEVEATDAARREAQERGVDLTQIEGTGSGGRITVVDVVEFAEANQDESEREPQASDAARRKAEELGIDLGQIEGTGSNGLITVKDVTDLAEDAAGGAQQAAGQAAQQAGEAAQGATGAVQNVADGAVQQAQDTVEGATGGGEIKATNAAQRKAEEMGVDLNEIEGSGAGGLITIKDVVKA